MTTQIEDIFATYDVIASEVLSDTSPNTEAGLQRSNMDLVESICAGRGWEDFDLFEPHDFTEVFAGEDAGACLDYAFLAFLRWRVFTVAAQRTQGIQMFNIKAAATSEYWYITLTHRWHELTNPSSSPTKWKH